MPNSVQTRASFRELHQSGCFVIPNPWDVGSARYLELLGFKALATTSSGFAFSRGLPDSAGFVSRDAVLQHFAEISQAVNIPVAGDFMSGYGSGEDELAESVRLCIESGVAGFSLEDMTGDPEHPLMDISEAVDRIRIARSVIEASGCDLMLTARAECYFTHHPDPFRESVTRLQAYAEAGADVLFAPGAINPVEVGEIVRSVSPKPINVIVSSNVGLRVSDLAELGVRRISIGSAFARSAWGALMRAAKAVMLEGTFEEFDQAVSYAELSQIFTTLNQG